MQIRLNELNLLFLFLLFATKTGEICKYISTEIDNKWIIQFSTGDIQIYIATQFEPIIFCQAKLWSNEKIFIKYSSQHTRTHLMGFSFYFEKNKIEFIINYVFYFHCIVICDDCYQFWYPFLKTRNHDDSFKPRSLGFSRNRQICSSVFVIAFS